MPREVRSHRQDHTITKSDLEGARRHQSAWRLPANQRRDTVLRRKRRNHFGGTRRVLVDEHRDLPVVALGPERFCKDGHRATRSSKSQYQWKDAEFRLWNAIKGGKAFFVEALASDGAAHAVANPAPISAQVAHQAEASDATSSVPPQV
jgi:hypothetical protein